MNNISIKYRIFLVAAVAMLGMVTTAVMLVWDKNETANELARLNHLGTIATIVSSVVHEMQKERGMSALYISSEGLKFSAELFKQRKMTSAKQIILDNFFGTFDVLRFDSVLNKKIGSAYTALMKINTSRRDVDNLGITVDQMATYYTGTIAKLLSVIEEMTNLSSNADVTRAITAYTSFLQGKERAGLERAMGAVGFGNEVFSPIVYHSFIVLMGQQRALFSTFKQYGTSDQVHFYDSTISGVVVSEVARMRTIAVESNFTGDTGNIRAEHWFAEYTKKINLMKRVEDRISADLLELISSIQQAAFTTLIIQLSVITVLMICIAAAVYIISRGIVKPIYSMITVMDQLARGNNNVDIQNLGQKDEIGEIARSIQVFKDNAIEKNQLEKLKMASEERQQNTAWNFQKLIEEANAPIIVLNRRGQIIEWNAEAAAVSGHNISEVHYCNFFNEFVAEGSRRQLTELFGRTVQGEKLDSFELPLLDKNGEVVTLLVGATSIFDQEGKLENIVYVGQDISALVRTEEALRRSQKMEAVGHLTGGIAHDFNNILGIALGNLELLQETQTEDSGSSVFIDPALEAIRRGADITRRLLSFSRKEAQQISRVCVNSSVEKLLELIEKSLTATIKVETCLSETLWHTNVNSGDFEDAILNLSINARDAMPEGGNLSIETANVFIDADQTIENPDLKIGEYVMISVSDTGTGMTDEIKEQILEPFFTTKEQGRGTGLGLSMVYGFIQRSKGFLDIKSQLNKGTKFNLYLPRALENQTSDEEGEVKSDELPVGDELILIVDDEEGLREIARFLLEELGYTVLTAENGDQALEIIKKTPDIDLLFSDVIMPGKLDGYKLSLAGKRENPNLKTVLTSGFTKDKETIAVEENSYLFEANKSLLHKPYNILDLAFAVRYALDAQSELPEEKLQSWPQKLRV